VARALDLDELIEHFTLYPDELERLRNKAGATRLGFALLLKFLHWKARFPGRVAGQLDRLRRQAGRGIRCGDRLLRLGRPPDQTAPGRDPPHHRVPGVQCGRRREAHRLARRRCLSGRTARRTGPREATAGRHTLDAVQVLEFVRQCEGLRNGDVDRERRQQYFLSEAFKRVFSAGILRTRAP